MGNPRKFAGNLFVYGVLSLAAAAAVFPFFWITCVAIRPITETYKTPITILPHALTLENFDQVLTKLPNMATFYQNSLIITGVTVLCVVLISGLAGYTFGRLKFPGRNLLFWAVLFSMFLPITIGLPALYEMEAKFRLLNSLQGLIMPYISMQLAVNVLIMRGVFAAIPQDLEDAAIIDGCSQWGVFRRIMMPLGASGLVTVAIFTFVPVWGEYLLAVTFVDSAQVMPLAVGIKLLQSSPATAEWTFPVAAAAALITFIPAALIFIVLQKWFTKGLMEGALKF